MCIIIANATAELLHNLVPTHRIVVANKQGGHTFVNLYCSLASIDG